MHRSPPQRLVGRTVIIAASGLSLTAQVSTIRSLSKPGLVLLTVNSTFRTFMDADMLYAGDHLWWKGMMLPTAEKPTVREFKGEKWTQDRTAYEKFNHVLKMNWIKARNTPGLGTANDIHMNGNSGFAAINLAYLLGSRRIVLVGFDMKLGPKGEKHHHKDHPVPMVQGQTFDQWIRYGAVLAKDLERHGCDVANCTTDTALTCFRRSTLEKELCEQPS
jgi:hypothetical protein